MDRSQAGSNRVFFSEQIEALEAARDYPKVAIRSCHGSGKSYVAALIILWFSSSLFHVGRIWLFAVLCV
jgi:hypothetical protein